MIHSETVHCSPVSPMKPGDRAQSPGPDSHAPPYGCPVQGKRLVPTTEISRGSCTRWRRPSSPGPDGSSARHTRPFRAARAARFSQTRTNGIAEAVPADRPRAQTTDSALAALMSYLRRGRCIATNPVFSTGRQVLSAPAGLADQRAVAADWMPTLPT